MRAVVGVDGGAGGRAAIVLARALGCRLLLVHVRAIAPDDIGAAFDPAAAADSHRLLERERDWAGLVAADILSVVAAEPAAGLHHVAEGRGADLLVLGRPDSRPVVGLERAPCPVAVAPRGYGRHGQPWGAIGVGCDGSPQGRVAREYASRLADEVGAEVLSLSVEGDAGTELAALSGEVDLMVCGSRPEGIRRRVMLGATTRHLARVSACPLVIVPAGVPADALTSA